MNVQAVMSDTVIEQKKTPIIQKILVVMGMMSLMGGTITGAMTYMNVGLSNTFFTDWITNFLTAAITVMPLGFTIMVLLTKGAEKVLPNMAAKPRDALVGVTMALIMESGMAFTSALNNVGLEDQTEFFSAWTKGIVGALPVALLLMVIVSMTIKPKVERFLKS